MALLGLFKANRHGSINTAGILLYALTSCIAGYVSSSYYRKFQGTSWVSNIILTSCLFTGKSIIALKKIKFSLYLRYYAQACNGWRGVASSLGNTASIECRSGGTTSDGTGPGIEFPTSRADCVRITAELTGWKNKK